MELSHERTDRNAIRRYSAVSLDAKQLHSLWWHDAGKCGLQHAVLQPQMPRCDDKTEATGCRTEGGHAMSARRPFLQDALIYPTITVTDHRNQVTKVTDMDNPIHVKAAFVSNTGTTVAMHIDDPLPDGLDMNSQVGWAGGMWNAGPPAIHNGTRHTRYWSVDLKRTS
jgi:hypothetical protein